MKRRIGALMLALCLSVQLTVSVGAVQSDDGASTAVSASASTAELSEYYSYIWQKETRYPIQQLSTQPAAGTGAEYPATVKGRENAVLLSKDNALASFTVQVPEEGLYRLNLTYCLLMENTLNATFRLYLDGKNAISECTILSISAAFHQHHRDYNGRERK